MGNISLYSSLHQRIQRCLLLKCTDCCLTMKRGRNANIKDSLISTFRLSAAFCAQVKIIINCVVKISDQSFGSIAFIGDQRTNSLDFSVKNLIFFRKFNTSNISFVL